VSAQRWTDWPSVGEADRITLAQEQRRAVFAPVTPDDLDAVQAVEKSAYAHPWSLRHFADSVQAGHPAMMLLGEALPDEVVFPRRPDGRVLLGYLIAMPGVQEMHLLNITVAPAHQRQGWGCLLLDALVLWSRGQGAQWLWLEVRAGNAAARRMYERYGFRQVGLRKGYYPAGQFQREDAIVMNYPLLNSAAHGEMP
jgi:[ribosomal protein S18]-alanine N-acetyltransferase